MTAAVAGEAAALPVEALGLADLAVAAEVRAECLAEPAPGIATA